MGRTVQHNLCHFPILTCISFSRKRSRALAVKNLDKLNVRASSGQFCLSSFDSWYPCIVRWYFVISSSIWQAFWSSYWSSLFYSFSSFWVCPSSKPKRTPFLKSCHRWKRRHQIHTNIQNFFQRNKVKQTRSTQLFWEKNLDQVENFEIFNFSCNDRTLLRVKPAWTNNRYETNK